MKAACFWNIWGFRLKKGKTRRKGRRDGNNSLDGENEEEAEAEKQAVKSGDLGVLYKLGVVYNAIMALSRVCGYDGVTYVRKLREAAGLPEIKEQIEVLQKRANTRRG